MVLQIVKIKDIIRPPDKVNFNDVYIVYELMDTDLNQIISSSQPLTDDHCQVSTAFLFCASFSERMSCLVTSHVMSRRSFDFMRLMYLHYSETATCLLK